MEQVEAGLEILTCAVRDESITVNAWALPAWARSWRALPHVTGVLQLLQCF